MSVNEAQARAAIVGWQQAIETAYGQQQAASPAGGDEDGVKIKDNLGERKFEDQAEKKKTFGEPGPDKDGRPGVSVELGKKEWDDHVAELSGTAETTVGGVDLKSKGEASLGTDAEATAELTPDGVKLGAEASVGAKAKGEASAEYGIAEVKAEGEASLGVNGEASLTAGPTGVDAKVEAFAGGKVEGEVGADVGGVGVGVKGEAWAGAGIEAGATIGMGDDGKFHLGGEVGAALGVGGKIGGEITIDPAEVAETVGDAADAVGDFANETGERIGDVASALNPFD